MSEIVELRRKPAKLTAEDIISALALLITLKPVPKELLSPEQAALVVADWRAKKAEIERLRSLGLGSVIADRDDAAEAMRQRCEEIARLWLSPGKMELRAGEMTAQEKRTAKAIVSSIANAIAALKRS